MTHDVPPHDDGADRTGGSDSDPVGHLPAADTAAINSGTRTIPSTREYSVCNRK